MSLIEVKNTHPVELFFFSRACLDDVSLGCHKNYIIQEETAMASVNYYQKLNESLKE